MAGPAVSPDKLTLVTAWFCPFAQRTWIAINAKGIEYDCFEITHDDLYSKPRWFLDLNPKGMIPVLAMKTPEGSVETVYESLICNEFLEDLYPDKPLLPGDALQRAKVRLMLERFGSKFVSAFYRCLMRQDAASQQEAAAVLLEELRWLETQAHPEGPFLLGKELSLADAALLPFLLRLPILQHYRGLALPQECARLARCIQAGKEAPAVKSTMVQPEGKDYMEALVASYERYADGTAGSQMARDAKADK